MGIAYSTAPWANFFVAEVGASAALVGLLFVAVSINLTKIFQFPTLPGRAFEALVILVLVLFVATFGARARAIIAGAGNRNIEHGARRLVNDGVHPGHGSEGPVCPAKLDVVSHRHGAARDRADVVAGVSLIVGCGGGLYWTLAAVLGSFFAALSDAWVLLVEIQR